MKKRVLGKCGLEVSAIGLGCMGMSEFYGTTNNEQSKATILAALGNGVTMLDTADCYGNGHNEELIGSALKEWQGDVNVATKFGIVRENGKYERTINGRPEYVKQAAEDSLRRLGRDVIDLYYIHRVDVNVPIEETVGAMSELVREGKVRYIGISEASVSTIKRAHAVHPLTALQTEYSLWTRNVEKEILPTIKELGIGLVAYSPLGRGFLTGRLDKSILTQEGDFRKSLPRLQGENYKSNQELVEKLEALAKEHGVKAGQLALAWVLAKDENIVPIPGTKRMSYLMENIHSTEISLSPQEMEKIEFLFSFTAIKGERYPEAGMKGINA